MIPGVKMGDIALNFEHDKVDFNFGGSVPAQFVNLFKGVYLNYAINQVQSQMISQMNNTIPGVLNYNFYSIDGYLLPFSNS